MKKNSTVYIISAWREFKGYKVGRGKGHFLAIYMHITSARAKNTEHQIKWKYRAPDKAKKWHANVCNDSTLKPIEACMVRITHALGT